MRLAFEKHGKCTKWQWESHHTKLPQFDSLAYETSSNAVLYPGYKGFPEAF